MMMVVMMMMPIFMHIEKDYLLHACVPPQGWLYVYSTYVHTCRHVDYDCTPPYLSASYQSAAQESR